jgi:anti-sigma regulatory factor (Ser/Thr protein kinase)
MTKVRVRGEAIRKYIVDHVDRHPLDVPKVTAEHFGITRQAVNKHLARLVSENALTKTGNTRAIAYHLRPIVTWSNDYQLASGPAEDAVWREDVGPRLAPLPDNVLNIWHYGFTEMFNNAIDHSEGSTIGVRLEKTAASSQIVIYDDGVGIFRKIQAQLGLLEERHAVLELAKGKLTTDPARHTGEGIFFTSRMFDDFEILSGGVYFSHRFGSKEDWILERSRASKGTVVWMKLSNHTARTTKKVFDQFTSGDDYGFNKTVVPVRLAQYGDDKLVSRSQAKRLLVRIDRFKTVILDFTGVESIGQAFADEIFRVFANAHPRIELLDIHANEEVQQMIRRARSAGTFQ